ncbi:uncharacterized protein LOC106650890 isoform X2 [Trichogramma pretiosum]|uniref:uncharacterized protein LOC106650890 isoform X2 n=1 Tax=Trichogramma pretiosum TaxID=7493 RepID=UPI000C71A526|nr:uncharacterized protein LOC106650890 isoform X2 [Trichogramma pretiosum]
MDSQVLSYIEDYSMFYAIVILYFASIFLFGIFWSWKIQRQWRLCKNSIRVDSFSNSLRSLRSLFLCSPNSTFNEKSNCDSVATKCTFLSDFSINPEDEIIRKGHETKDELNFDNNFRRWSTHLKNFKEPKASPCWSSTKVTMNESNLLSEDNSCSCCDIKSSEDSTATSTKIHVKSIMSDLVDRTSQLLSIWNQLSNKQHLNEDLRNENLQQSIKITHLEAQIIDKNITIGELKDLNEKSMKLLKEMKHNYEQLKNEHSTLKLRNLSSTYNHSENVENILNNNLRNVSDICKTNSETLPWSRRSKKASSSSMTYSLLSTISPTDVSSCNDDYRLKRISRKWKKICAH